MLPGWLRDGTCGERSSVQYPTSSEAHHTTTLTAPEPSHRSPTPQIDSARSRAELFRPKTCGPKEVRVKRDGVVVVGKGKEGLRRARGLHRTGFPTP